MSNKEKMIAGRLYIASDPQLAAERTAARKLNAEFNATSGTCSLPKVLTVWSFP
jgi:hypothetical protein